MKQFYLRFTVTNPRLGLNFECLLFRYFQYGNDKIWLTEIRAAIRERQVLCDICDIRREPVHGGLVALFGGSANQNISNQ